MKINTETNHYYTSQPTPTSASANVGSTPFSSVLATATTEATDAKLVDFTSMTRQEMFDWMNHQIRSGKMSLDESSPFLGMTMKISVATGQPVDMATDTTRINFMEKARLGIEGALTFDDQDSAERLRAAIDIMVKQQGQIISVDMRA